MFMTVYESSVSLTIDRLNGEMIRGLTSSAVDHRFAYWSDETNKMISVVADSMLIM